MKSLSHSKTGGKIILSQEEATELRDALNDIMQQGHRPEPPPHLVTYPPPYTVPPYNTPAPWTVELYGPPIVYCKTSGKDERGGTTIAILKKD